MAAASSTTAVSSRTATASNGSPTKSRTFKDRIERHRWLIQRIDTGEFLGTIIDGQLIWVAHPLDALQHCQMEVACNNLYRLREHYHDQVSDGIRLEPMMFYAYVNAPTQWFTDYD